MSSPATPAPSTPLPTGRRGYEHLWLLLGLVGAVVFWFCGGYLNRYYVGVLMDVGINVTLAVSLNLINGHTGQFSLGHAGFMAVGAYIGAKLTLLCGGYAVAASLQPLLLLGGLLLGGLAAALVGLAVGVPTLRLRGDYLAIVTLGFGEIIRVFFQTSEFFGAATGLTAIPTFSNLAWVWGVAAITVYVVTSLVNSTYGRGFLAVHDDEIAASAMGVNPVRYKVTAFVVGAFFAGVAGALFAHQKNTVQPTGFDFMRSIEIVVMVILGGMGRTAGVVLAAIILTILPELLREVAAYRMIIYSLIIIILMLTRPQGLFTFSKRGPKV